MQDFELTSVKNWLLEFLVIRGLAKPDGRPLHGYRVTQPEYEQMRVCLNAHRRDVLTVDRKKAWAATFCLFVAECYRREYDARAVGWTWANFEQRLGSQIELSVAQHAELTQLGLENFWCRPIRHREHGRDLLGSLFAEGGLPWLLLQNEAHGFGKAIRAGLRNYYRAAAERRSVIDLMGSVVNALPQVFQNLETRQLLAAVVQQLMFLAENYPLHRQTDPSAFLDQSSSGWRSQFPIPLDEANGRRLLNDWLKDAGQRRQERADEVARDLAFSCTHFLRGTPPEWGLTSELVLPESAEFTPTSGTLRNTRLELAVFEGQQLRLRAGAAYAQPQGDSWGLRFPRARLRVERRDPPASLSLRLLVDGVMASEFTLAGDAVAFDELPLIFAPHEERWQLVATASCALVAREVLVRLPTGYTIVGVAGDVIATEADGAFWLRCTSDLRCLSDADVFTIRLGCDAATSVQLTLKGRTLPYDASPGLVYLGWPRLVVPCGAPFSEQQLAQFIDGRPLTTVPKHERVGALRYSVKGPDGETLLRRRFGVLPAEFGLALQASAPARVILRDAGAVVPAVLNANVKTSMQRRDNEIVLGLEAELNQLPRSLLLALHYQARPGTIELRLPFPYQGAALYDAEGNPAKPGKLVLGDLLGGERHVVLGAGRRADLRTAARIV
ncbi:MAG: STY4851/ECs_5259 family protein [Burkholderiaceae bacterium]|nr:STY4851/ECs_5259 family protein [Burkholderiaceae bacterium]